MQGEGWSKRPLTSSEVTQILKSFLEESSDVLLSSHSMKTTLLSWCSKAGVEKEHRRLLGRHSTAVVDADSNICQGYHVLTIGFLRQGHCCHLRGKVHARRTTVTVLAIGRTYQQNSCASHDATSNCIAYDTSDHP